MRGHGSQHTTMPLSGQMSHSIASESLSLGWLFPCPTDPELSLDLKPGDELVIGRDEDCSVRFLGGDISRRHARIYREGTEIIVADLGSRNGTFVNGCRKASECLGLNDIVRFGGRIGIVTDRPGHATEITPGLLAGPHLASELEPVMRAAPSDLPVILEGETGTGKEVVARAIHAWSARSGPFVAVNCAALPEALAEGELFGYRRGAFTGAERGSPGFFRSAEGGTLLLDEVSDLPLSIQAKLLRVLEQREVQPLGETQPVGIDVRMIVATQEPLIHAVQLKKFRQDLLARLNGICVNLPPLRKRVGDVLPMLTRLLAKLTADRTPAYDVNFVERLCVYDWPFNVREVVLLAKRIAVLHGEETCLRVAHLPNHMTGSLEQATEVDKPRAASARAPKDPADFPALIAALRASHGNVAQAAAMLSISRQRAYRLMQGQAVDLEALRSPEEAPA